MRYVILALTALAVAAPAGAAAAAAEDSAKPVKEKKVCRRTVDTGSIMPVKVCRTVTEWSKVDSARAKQAERDTDEMRNRTPTGGLNSGSAN